MAQLNQTLLHKVANRLGKKSQYIREQVARRASREGVASPVALVMWARDLGIGVASALDKLEPLAQQQLSVPRVVPARRTSRPAAPRRRDGRRGRPPVRRSGRRRAIFISHAAKDRALAGALAELLRSALTLEAREILCTSVDGYRLAGGSNTDEALRREILGAKTVVGIITPASGRSAYVQAELGGRWVTDKHMIPVTARGVKPGDVRGPAGGLNALDLRSRASVHQLVGDVGTVLGKQSEPAHVFQHRVEEVIREAKSRGRRGR
jgi:TIR domain